MDRHRRRCPGQRARGIVRGFVQDRADRRPPLALARALELAIVAWVAWFNHDRLHSSLGDIPPVEFEQRYAAAIALNPRISVDGSVAAITPKPANGLTTSRASTIGVDFVVDRPISRDNTPVVRALPAQAAPQAGQR
ncbi:MAG: IS3 family transposase [Solirubrobacteraceae bacterium]